MADASYDRVIALVRRPIVTSHQKLHQELTNFEAFSKHPVSACDAAYCALGTTIRTAGSQAAFRRVDHDYVASFAQWARAGGTQSFALVSSVGADANSGNFYLRTKGEAEQSVERVGIRDTHLFRPSILIGDRAETRVGESIGVAFMHAVQFGLVGKLRRYRATAAFDVARAMVAASRGRYPGVHVYEYPDIIRLASGSHGQ